MTMTSGAVRTVHPVSTIAPTPKRRKGLSITMAGSATSTSKQTLGAPHAAVPSLKPITFLPPALRAAATEPVVNISENGQFQLNTVAGLTMADCVAVYFLADLKADGTRNSEWIGLQGLTGKIETIGEGDAAEQKVSITDPKTKGINPDLIKRIQWAKGNGTNPVVSASQFLRLVGYDYAKSGRQSFTVESHDLVVDAKNHVVQFRLPSGSLTPKPVVARSPRAKKANSGDAPNEVAAPANEDELANELVEV